MSEIDEKGVEIIAVLSADWRVVLCDAGIQWMLQHRQKSGRWKSVSFNVERKALLWRVDHHVKDPDPAALRILQALPERRVREGKSHG